MSIRVGRYQEVSRSRVLDDDERRAPDRLRVQLQREGELQPLMDEQCRAVVVMGLLPGDSSAPCFAGHVIGSQSELSMLLWSVGYSIASNLLGLAPREELQDVHQELMRLRAEFSRGISEAVLHRLLQP